MSGTAGWRFAWAIVALGAAAATPSLVELWLLPDNTHGFFMAAAAAAAAWGAREDFRSQPHRPRLIGLAVVACAAILHSLVFYLSLTFGPRQSVVWLRGASLLLAAIGLLVAGAGASRAWAFRRAFLFLLLALPLPGTFGWWAQSHLRGLAVTVSQWIFEASGLPVSRTGLILTLPAGRLLIAEACSGLRSLTSFVAMSFVIAWMHGRGLAMGAVLALIAIPVAVVLNIARIVGSGWLREFFGSAAVEGTAHEAFAAVLFAIGLGLLWLTAGRLTRSNTSQPEPSPAPFAPAASGVAARGGRLAAASLAAALFACLGIATWPEQVPAPILPTLPAQMAVFQGRDIPETADFRSLKADRTVNRLYRDDRGRELKLWVGYWASDLRLGPHDPDACFAALGWSKVDGASRFVRPVLGGPGVDVALRTYRIGLERRTVLFWGQQGRVILSPQPGLFEIQNIARIVATPPHTTARLFVHMGITHEPSEATDLLSRFAAEMMGPLYELAPWAEPSP